MPNEASRNFPIFPAELEREIFELAALFRPTTIPDLMLVASYVKNWVEPFLYRTIVFEHPIDGYPAFDPYILIRAIQSKPAAFFRNYVRHLNLRDSSYPMTREEAHFIISACTGVENLIVTDSDASILSEDFLRNLRPLKRLSIGLQRLFHPSVAFFRPHLGPAPIDFNHRVFSQLTHLEISDLLNFDTTQWVELAILPALTHLSFHHGTIVPLFKLLLDTPTTSLEVLVLLTPSAPTWETQGGLRDTPLVQDARFVAMSCLDRHRDWQMGAHSGDDYWSRAEEFVAQRRAGRVDRGSSSFPSNVRNLEPPFRVVH
ncbi:hypothetical protein C8R46DRAFT_1091741 [Mycena filopes]|nr:hypothetical protein C8R46DRAFT_1091741 [Mycena filopes]